MGNLINLVPVEEACDAGACERRLCAAGNGLQSAKGDEAVLQRMLMKLTARRGQFPFMENFGSRLWTLDRLRPADRQAAAEQYVLEALRDEPGLMVEQVTLAENGGKSSLTVNAVKDERRLTAEMALGQEGVTM